MPTINNKTESEEFQQKVDSYIERNCPKLLEVEKILWKSSDESRWEFYQRLEKEDKNISKWTIEEIEAILDF